MNRKFDFKLRLIATLVLLCLLGTSLISCTGKSENETPVYDIPEINYTPYESLDHKESSIKATKIRVECENYDEISFTPNNIEGVEFSAGKILSATIKDKEWSKDYYVSYNVTVEDAGTYAISGLFDDLKRSYTNDFFVYVNGKQAFNAGETFSITEHFPATFDANLMKVMDLGEIELTEGINEIKFLLDSSDPREDGSIVFFADYFELSNASSFDSKITIEYDYKLDETYAETLTAASKVNVFDSTYPVKFTFEVTTKRSRFTEYVIKDYYDKPIYSGSFELEKGKTTFEKGVYNHPTGYFTIEFDGNMTASYVVTPPIYTRIDESPFAMDFASDLVHGVENVYSLACAAKAAGVTWVREREYWSECEMTEGTYKFTNHEKNYNAISKAGLKTLAMICYNPKWTVDENYPTSSDSSYGGFMNSRLQIYNFAKEIAKYYDDIVDAWEFWNEEDSTFAAETAEIFSSWYKSAAIGTADSGTDALATYGGLCISAKSNYAIQLMMNGLTDYSDISNYHNHVMFTRDYIDYNAMPEVITNQAIVDLYAGGDASWITESGMWLDRDQDGNVYTECLTRQAKYVVTSTAQSLSNGTGKHFWFLLAPYLENGGDFGTFSSDFNPYPSLAAESVMTYMLGKAEYIGTLSDLPSNSEGILFETGSGKVGVLWSQEATEYTFNSWSSIKVTDLMGNTTIIKPKFGKITIELSDSPIYISYSKTPKYSVQSSVTAYTAKRDYTVGEKVLITPLLCNDGTWDNHKEFGYKLEDGQKIKVVITNLNNFEVTGSLAGSLKNCEIESLSNITIPAMSEITIEMSVKINGNFNDYLKLTGNFNGFETSPSVSHVHNGTAELDPEIIITGLEEGLSYKASKLKSIIVIANNIIGNCGVSINGAPISSDKISKLDDGYSVNLSSLKAGKYRLTFYVINEETKESVYKAINIVVK